MIRDREGRQVMRNVDTNAVRSVLHVTQVASYGGLINCLADHVTAQVAHGWRVSVACPPGDLQDLARAAGAQVLTWDAQRSPVRGLPRECLTLRRLVALSRPDVVHLHSSKAGLVGRLVLRGRRPVVFSPHSWSWNHVTGATAVAARLWELWAARWADLVVCVSQQERAEGEQAGVRSRYRVVPNAVDLSALMAHRPGDAPASAVPTGQGARAVCVGRLCRQKGQDVLLDAWQTVTEAIPDAELLVIGDGPDLEVVSRRAAELQNVVLAGRLPRSEVLAHVAAADVCVQPSRWEGMSLAMLEARALGTRVIACDVAGARESLGDGAGVVVPVEDVPALSRALVHALRMRRAPREDTRRPRKDDLEESTQGLMDSYSEVLRARAADG
jgi:glycosyltransferase involved in cell wall biosynthesis